MSLYARLALVTAIFAALCAGAIFCFRAGANSEKAKQADIERAVQATREAAQLGAAEAISKIEIKQQTIVQKVQHEIQTKPVYRDCVVPADGVRLLNDAINGKAEGGPSGSSAVQGAASAAD